MKTGRSLTALLLAALLSFGSLSAALAFEESPDASAWAVCGQEEVDAASSAPAEPDGAESQEEPEGSESQEEPEQPEEEPELSTAPAEEPVESSPEEDPEMSAAPQEEPETSPAGTGEDAPTPQLTPQDGEPVSQGSEEEGDDEGEEAPTDPTTDPNYFSPVVELLEGEENAYPNYKALRSAMMRADGVHPLTVKVARPGAYYLSYKENSSHHKGIRLRSLTTLDLNGATIIRTGTTGNLVQVETLEGQQSVAGYTAARDVAIVNGTLDGGEGEEAAIGVNVVNIGHVDGLRFENLTITHGQGTHLVELNGCRNVTIQSCTFSGFEPWEDKKAEDRPEAIQLDISYNGAATNWNGVYCDVGTPGNDQTVCQNVTIRDCRFLDYPSGVGNHHALYKWPKSSGIRIVNNSFENSQDFGYLGYALQCYGFVNCEVSGNRFIGKYAVGVFVRGGQVAVKDNQFGSASRSFSGRPIYVDSANSNVPGELTARKREYVYGSSIEGNTIYTSRSSKKEGAVTIQGHASLDSISRNTITASKSCGITVKGSGKVTNLTKNTVKKSARSAVYVSGGKVTNLERNTLTGGRGVEIVGKSTVTNVRKNPISAQSSQGIAVSGGSKVTRITGNQVKKAAKNAVYISEGTVTTLESNTLSSRSTNAAVMVCKKSKVNSLSKNSVKAAKGAGVSVSGSSKVNSLKNNKINAPAKDGIVVSGATATKIEGNQVKKGKKNGIVVSANGVASRVCSNSVTGCKGTGIRILNPKLKVTVQKNRLKGNKKAMEIVKKDKKQDTEENK